MVCIYCSSLHLLCRHYSIAVMKTKYVVVRSLLLVTLGTVISADPGGYQVVADGNKIVLLPSRF